MPSVSPATTARILLVEDDTTDPGLHAALGDGGHAISRVDDAESAVTALLAAPFDLILSDVHLRDGTGFDLCRRVKATPMLAKLPVLLVTSEAEPINVLRGLEAGADGFLTRGRQPAEVLARVDRLLANGPRRSLPGPRSVAFAGQEFQLANDPAQIEDVLLAAFEDVLNLRGALSRERDGVQTTLSGVLDTVPVGIVVVDAQGTPRLVNQAARRLLGTASTANVTEWARSARMHLPDGTAARMADVPTFLTLSDGESRFEVELRCGGEDGTPALVSSTAFRDADGNVSEVVSAFTIITDRKAAEEKLARAAYYDALTSLPNRRLFVERLGRAMLSNDRKPDLFAVLFLDLDRFKVVNDSLGHQAGDLLLVQVARRLEQCARIGDTVARLGGDEFILLLPHLTIPADAIRVAERIRLSLLSPFDLDGQEANIGTSIGIALSSTGFDGPDEMVRDADTAMYQAKRGGKGRYAIFDPSMHAKAVERFQLEGELRRAVDREELCLEYQPLVSLVDGRVLALEALVRWNHPTRGLVAPGDFIRLAEETGIIVPMGRWILQRACEQVHAWQSQPGASAIAVYVNTSMKQVSDAGFVEAVRSALAVSGLNAGSLRLEIVETAQPSTVSRTAAVLSQLRAMGVTTTLDDFGVGQSSLSYLSDLPVTGLKIDRSFVSKLDCEDPSDRVLHVILNLGQTLSLAVTAEGIETVEQLRSLQRLGCAVGQGHLLSRPLPAEETRRVFVTGTVPSWAWTV